ncbi:MAG: hypothetical protein J6L64_06955 [Opitutales bacterium]|nr:hypothetical protein [Opitutales bacterium]
MIKKAFALAAWISAGFFAVQFSGCADAEPRSRVDVVEAMQKTLESVRDTETADAAAVNYVRLVETVEKFPDVTPSEKEHAEIAVGAWLGQIHRLEKEDYYGSEALKKALGLKQ